MIKFTKIIFILIIINTCLFSNENKKNVLIITSFSNSLQWDIEYTKAINEANSKYKNINFYKENLDSVNFSNFSKKDFFHYIKAKYHNITIDGIITESNPAYNFITEYGKILFPDIPYVYYTTEKMPSLYSKSINFTNTSSISNTLEIAFKHNQNANNIIIIDQENHQSITDEIKKIKDNVNIRNLSKFTLEEIINITSKIHNHTFIFFTVYFKDPFNKRYDPTNLIKEISVKSDIPIYSIYSVFLKDGIIGGDLINSNTLAKESMKAMNDLFNGKSNSYKFTKVQFNEKELKDKKIITSKEEVKEEPIDKIINLIKTDNKIIITLSIFILLFIIILILITSNNSKKKLIRKLKEENDLIVQERKEKDKTEKSLIQQSKMAALGDMLQNIAHQWRQPLSVISTSASGIQMNRQLDIVDEKLENDSLDKILENTRYLSNTIEVFRNFFKPSNVKEFFELKKAINEAIYLAHIESNSYYNITIERDIEDIRINSFKNEFIQALLNIINNAKDALMQNIEEDNDRIIKITVSQKQNNIVVSIKDNANGIPENIINKIFQPYFTTKHKDKGTGIGLYMTNEIITKHMKGRIVAKNSVFSQNKKEYYGANFIIYLPTNL